MPGAIYLYSCQGSCGCPGRQTCGRSPSPLHHQTSLPLSSFFPRLSGDADRDKEIRPQRFASVTHELMLVFAAPETARTPFVRKMSVPRSVSSLAIQALSPRLADRLRTVSHGSILGMSTTATRARAWSHSPGHSMPTLSSNHPSAAGNRKRQVCSPCKARPRMRGKRPM